MMEYDIRKSVKNLTDKEKKLLAELSDRISGWKTPHFSLPTTGANNIKKKMMEKFAQEKEYFLSKLQLYRYLYGEEFNVDRAEAEIKNTIAWRLKEKPEQIKLKDCEMAAKEEFLFHHGYDKQGQPICYILMKKFSNALAEAGNNPEAMEEFSKSLFRLLMRTCEQLQQQMLISEEEEETPVEQETKEEKNNTPKKTPRKRFFRLRRKKNKLPSHVHRITWIIDLKGASVSMAQAKALKDIFYAMGQYYPERMARCVVINASFWINIVYNFAKSFMTSTTKAKLKFYKGTPQQVQDKLSAFIEPDQIPAYIGGYGTSNFKYSYRKALEEEEEEA